MRSAAALDGPAQAGTEKSYGRLTWVDVSLPVEIPGATTQGNDLHTSDVEWAGLGLQINGRAGNTGGGNGNDVGCARVACMFASVRLGMFSFVSP